MIKLILNEIFIINFKKGVVPNALIRYYLSITKLFETFSLSTIFVLELIPDGRWGIKPLLGALSI
jgi:hypothetical protein